MGDRVYNSRAERGFPHGPDEYLESWTLWVEENLTARPVDADMQGGKFPNLQPVICGLYDKQGRLYEYRIRKFYSL